ncbi:MAG: HAD family phosphatase [Patescibacteria group bacterium]
MNNIKGVIFDFNGVLWWDSDIVERSWAEYSKQLRGTPLSHDEYQTYVHGRPNGDTIEYLLNRKLTRSEIAKMAIDKESIYKKMCLEIGDNFKLSPGAVEFLDFLKSKKIPHTIATASEISNVKFFFEHLQLEKWFDFEKVVYDDGTFLGNLHLTYILLQQTN